MTRTTRCGKSAVPRLTVAISLNISLLEERPQEESYRQVPGQRARERASDSEHAIDRDLRVESFNVGATVPSHRQGEDVRVDRSRTRREPERRQESVCDQSECWYEGDVVTASPGGGLSNHTMDGALWPHAAARELGDRVLVVWDPEILSEAGWECLIGLGLLIGRGLRGILLLLYMQMLGTLTPIFPFPHEVFVRIPYAPTLEGQYIIKNLVLISAGIVVGATVRGGSMVPEPPVEEMNKTAARIRCVPSR
jgi:hypothetical protein